MKEPRAQLEIADFSGMASNVDPTDVQPGVSRLQVNVHSIRRGELAIRRGLRELSFDEEDSDL